MRTKVLRAEEAIAQVAEAAKPSAGVSRRPAASMSAARAAAPATPADPRRRSPPRPPPRSRRSLPTTPRALSSHGRRDDHHCRGQPHARPRNCGTRRTGWRSELHHRIHAAHLRPAGNDWKDGEALFLRASCWREFAEHVAGSLTKGCPRRRDRPPSSSAPTRRRRARSARDRARDRRDRPEPAIRHRPGHPCVVRRGATGRIARRAPSPTSRGPLRARPGWRSRATCGTRPATDETPF